MLEVDPAFIQAVEHRPKPSINEGQNIPLIDLSILNSPNYKNTPELSRLVNQIGDACKNWGFFQVINHGVPFEISRKMEDVSRKFYALSNEEKGKVKRDEMNPLGYYDTEHTKNVRDWKEVFDFTVENPTFIPVSYEHDDDKLRKLVNQWPVFPSEMRKICEDYGDEMVKLSYKLLELISLSLGLEGDRFHSFFKDQTSFIRLNHYQPCPVPDLALGVGRHKDAGALTILAQDDVGGLEVKRKTDGEWVRVKPTPNAYIINVGDIIQVWSNDKYESVEHRVVVNSEKERFSIPFFLNPSHYTWVEPMKELINEHTQPNIRHIIGGSFSLLESLVISRNLILRTFRYIISGFKEHYVSRFEENVHV